MNERTIVVPCNSTTLALNMNRASQLNSSASLQPASMLLHRKAHTIDT